MVIVSNLNIDPTEWLEELFFDEYCYECLGDVEHHTAVPFVGNWFARCDYPRTEDDSLHPVLAEFHSIRETGIV
jgi:hypothetical protein